MIISMSAEAIYCPFHRVRYAWCKDCMSGRAPDLEVAKEALNRAEKDYSKIVRDIEVGILPEAFRYMADSMIEHARKNFTAATLLIANETEQQ